jgi:glycosyltransferase involved in cell wall biosynthesis
MANFGFIYTPSEGWIGGKNYYLSLFCQLNSEIEPLKDNVIIFTDYSCDTTELLEFEHLQVIRTHILSRRRLARFIFRAFSKVFGDNTALYFMLKKYNVDVLSHAYIPSLLGIKSLPWIPDFQHCILPEYFSQSEIKNRNAKFQKILNNEHFLLSSYSSLTDATNFFTIKGDARVYRFLPTPVIDFDYIGFNELCAQFKINKPFVFLPNQFWKHKNHMLCFKACLQAKQEGKSFTIVCTGGLSDYRHPDYEKQVDKFIKDNDLSSQIIRLGLVDRTIFNCLLDNAAVVANPSKFEGWSTTVEEGKSLNKRLALSNLNVHKEQAGESDDVIYFDSDDVNQCKNAIQILLVKASYPSFKLSTDSIYSILKSIIS